LYPNGLSIEFRRNPVTGAWYGVNVDTGAIMAEIHSAQLTHAIERVGRQSGAQRVPRAADRMLGVS
jgi:hypothetical protein